MAAMNQEKHILTLEPTELRFCGPLLRPCMTMVTLKNPNNFDVMYKFKTTAPRVYRVRPNLGIVRSHGDKAVRIVLMPFEFDLKERLVHKFMVLTAPAPDMCSDLRKVWSELDEDRMWCEKFRSIVEMARPIVPFTLELTSSSTSAEYEVEAPASCAGDTSQSEENLHEQALTPRLAETTQRERENLQALNDLQLEVNKLRELNETLTHEKESLVIELSRLRESEHKKHIMKKNNKLWFYIATTLTMAFLGAMIGKCVLTERVPINGLQDFFDNFVY